MRPWLLFPGRLSTQWEAGRRTRWPPWDVSGTFSSSVSFFLPEQPAFPRLAKWKHRLGSDESPEVTESAV